MKERTNELKPESAESIDSPLPSSPQFLFFFFPYSSRNHHLLLLSSFPPLLSSLAPPPPPPFSSLLLHRPRVVVTAKHSRYPPFYANDPISTCRKIVNYKKTLVFPADRVAHLSRACIDALHRLLCEPARRLGSAANRRGLPPSDIVQHPWFAGVPWESMQEVTAPFVRAHE